MNLNELRDDCARKQKKGLHFILASVLVWSAVLAVQLTELPVLTKNLMTFCCAAALLPLAFLIAKIIRVDFQNKDNPLTNLGILFSVNQMLYLLIAMWIYAAIPEKMLMVITIIFGAHLMPYSWLYRSKAYMGFSIIVPIAAFIAGLCFAPYVLAIMMIVFEIVFSILLVLENMGKRIMPTILISLLACLLVPVGALLGYSPGKPQPFLNADGTPLAGSVSEKSFVTIGGVEQGMFIRGKSSQNPVLLFLHGGPGMPEYFLAEKHLAGLEEHFTVCYWEQRGGGISYSSDIPPESITAQQLISDTIEVTNYLRERFGQEKIYLLAHSWGSFIGIQTVKQSPELYHAYIGVGQVAQMAESERRGYAYMLEQYAMAENESMVKKLRGYAVLESDEALRSFFNSALRDKAMHELGIGTMRDMKSVVTGAFLPIMQCRAYAPGEKVNIWRAKLFLRNETILIDQLFSTDLTVKVPQVEVPAYFVSGRYDYTVNYGLSKAYFQQIQAPAKGHYTFEQSAHSPLFEEPERFVQIMIEDVQNGTTALADAEWGGR